MLFDAAHLGFIFPTRIVSREIDPVRAAGPLRAVGADVQEAPQELALTVAQGDADGLLLGVVHRFGLAGVNRRLVGGDVVIDPFQDRLNWSIFATGDTLWALAKAGVAAIRHAAATEVFRDLMGVS